MDISITSLLTKFKLKPVNFHDQEISDWLIKVSLMSNRKIIARKETGRGTQERTLL
jgi:hypothetical protein